MEISFLELQALESHHVSFRVLYPIEVLQSKVSVNRPPLFPNSFWITPGSLFLTVARKFLQLVLSLIFSRAFAGFGCYSVLDPILQIRGLSAAKSSVGK